MVQLLLKPLSLLLLVNHGLHYIRLEQYGGGRLKESGTAGPANCIFFHSLILWNTHEALSYLRRKYRRNPEAKTCSPWWHTNFCLVLRCRSARFSWKGQKVTISLVYSRPGAHSSWDPFRCLTLAFHGGTESLCTLLCSWKGEEVRILLTVFTPGRIEPRAWPSHGLFLPGTVLCFFFKKNKSNSYGLYTHARFSNSEALTEQNDLFLDSLNISVNSGMMFYESMF